MGCMSRWRPSETIRPVTASAVGSGAHWLLLLPQRQGQEPLAGFGFNPRVGINGPMDLREFVSASAKSQNKRTPNSTIYKGLPVEDFTVAIRIKCAVRYTAIAVFPGGSFVGTSA